MTATETAAKEQARNQKIPSCFGEEREVWGFVKLESERMGINDSNPLPEILGFNVNHQQGWKANKLEHFYG